VITGERRANRKADHAARAIIAAELGHARLEVVATYCGSSR
jgi:hypothetical protein